MSIRRMHRGTRSQPSAPERDEYIYYPERAWLCPPTHKRLHRNNVHHAIGAFQKGDCGNRPFRRHLETIYAEVRRAWVTFVRMVPVRERRIWKESKNLLSLSIVMDQQMQRPFRNRRIDNLRAWHRRFGQSTSGCA